MGNYSASFQPVGPRCLYVPAILSNSTDNFINRKLVRTRVNAQTVAKVFRNGFMNDQFTFKAIFVANVVDGLLEFTIETRSHGNWRNATTMQFISKEVVVWIRRLIRRFIHRDFKVQVIWYDIVTINLGCKQDCIVERQDGFFQVMLGKVNLRFANLKRLVQVSIIKVLLLILIQFVKALVKFFIT